MADTSGSDQKGPWLLALGTLLIGGIAVSVEGYRAVRKRFRQSNDSSGNE